MVYIITEDCVNCGACYYECPEGAISEGDEIYIIDPKKCTDCGTCVNEVYCPAWAIRKEP